MTKHYNIECATEDLVGTSSRLVQAQVALVVLKQGESLEALNQRIKVIRTYYYTCYDKLGWHPTHTTEAYMSFFCKFPRLKKGVVHSLLYNVNELSERHGPLLSGQQYARMRAGA